jgi:hypothetical protein
VWGKEATAKANTGLSNSGMQCLQAPSALSLSSTVPMSSGAHWHCQVVLQSTQIVLGTRAASTAHNTKADPITMCNGGGACGYDDK